MREQISNKVFIVFSTYNHGKKKVIKAVYIALAECFFDVSSGKVYLSIFEMIIIKEKWKIIVVTSVFVSVVEDKALKARFKMMNLINNFSKRG